MSINFFEITTESSFVERPFVEDYAKSNPLDVEDHIVTSVRKTKKGNGYLVESDKFLIFLFNRSQLLQHLLEALAVWTKSGHGFKLVVKILPNDPYFKIGVDDKSPTNWLLTGGKYIAVDQITSTSEVVDPTLNPFLPIPSSGRHKKSQTQ